MKFKILPITLFLSGFSLVAQATVWNVKNSGNTFTPATITIPLGDTVVFEITNDHDAVEVSQATYNANGSTALSGGFSVSFGGGTIVPTLGDHWYVCTPHASMGMKGIIKVTTPNNIQDVFVTTKIDIYPNPVTDILSVRSTATLKNVQYSIVDITGKVISTGIFNGAALDVNVATLSNGAYYLQLGNDAQKRVHKFLKQD
jgi:plastocyanin